MSSPNRIMFYDLEVDNKPYYGALASPRHPDNFVVAEGWAVDAQPYDGKVEGRYYTSADQAKDWLAIPDDVWLLVCHNAPFEMDWMLVQQREKILAFLKRGGRVFCTAYAHYLLSNQQDTYPALDVIAPQYGGTPKVDGVKILWEQGKLTSEIDKDLLLEYLLGPSGDIDNTRRVFWGQVQQLQERGMWDMALDRMEGMLFNCFAMDAGLKVDRTLAFEERDRLAAEVIRLRERFQDSRSDMPPELEFKETSKHHMSAWVYGGPIKYRAKVPALHDDGTPKYVKGDFFVFGDTPVPVAEANTPEQFEQCVQRYGNPDRFKAGKNKGQMKVHRLDTDEPLLKWGEKVYQCPGLVPLKGLPPEFAEDFKQENSGKLKLSDESPVISVSAEALETLTKQPSIPSEQRELLTDLLRFFRMLKDLSTYYLVEEYDDEGNVVGQSGMLQYLTPEDIIHHMLNVTSTATGRLSSNRP